MPYILYPGEDGKLQKIPVSAMGPAVTASAVIRWGNETGLTFVNVFLTPGMMELPIGFMFSIDRSELYKSLGVEDDGDSEKLYKLTRVRGEAFAEALSFGLSADTDLLGAEASDDTGKYGNTEIHIEDLMTPNYKRALEKVFGLTTYHIPSESLSKECGKMLVQLTEAIYKRLAA